MFELKLVGGSPSLFRQKEVASGTMVPKREPPTDLGDQSAARQSADTRRQDNAAADPHNRFLLGFGTTTRVWVRSRRHRRKKRFSGRARPGCLECTSNRELLSGTRAIFFSSCLESYRNINFPAMCSVPKNTARSKRSVSVLKNHSHVEYLYHDTVNESSHYIGCTLSFVH